MFLGQDILFIILDKLVLIVPQSGITDYSCIDLPDTDADTIFLMTS